MFNNEIDKLEATFIDNSNQKTIKTITNEDFLLMKGETLLGKYGSILGAVKRK